MYRPVSLGYTLVEVMVALLLLEVGLLALVGAMGATARVLGESRRAHEAAVAAANRLEVLAALPCASWTGGSARAGPISVTWTVEAGAPARVLIVATRPTPRGERADTLEAVCVS